MDIRILYSMLPLSCMCMCVCVFCESRFPVLLTHFSAMFLIIIHVIIAVMFKLLYSQSAHYFFCCFDFFHLQQVSRVIMWCFNVFRLFDLTKCACFNSFSSAADLFIAWGLGEWRPYVSKCFALDGTSDIV